MRFIINLLSTGLKTSSLFCRPGLKSNIILFSLFVARPSPVVGKLNSLLPVRPSLLEKNLSFTGPARWKKSPFICRPCPLEKSSLIWWPYPILGPMQTSSLCTETCKTIVIHCNLWLEFLVSVF